MELDFITARHEAAYFLAALYYHVQRLEYPNSDYLSVSLEERKFIIKCSREEGYNYSRLNRITNWNLDSDNRAYYQYYTGQLYRTDVLYHLVGHAVLLKKLNLITQRISAQEYFYTTIVSCEVQYNDKMMEKKLLRDFLSVVELYGKIEEDILKLSDILLSNIETNAFSIGCIFNQKYGLSDKIRTFNQKIRDNNKYKETIECQI